MRAWATLSCRMSRRDLSHQLGRLRRGNNNVHACLSCFSVFKPEIISQIPQEPVGPSVEGVERVIDTPCPTIDCSGQVIELDELILPAIFVLNFKGYSTKNCCSGHPYSRIAETYVMFEAGVELPDLPHMFEIDEPDKSIGGKDHPTIRKLHDSADRVGSILLANKKLYDWTRGLPDLNEEHINQETEIGRRQNELLIMRMLAMGFSPYKQNIQPLIKKKPKQDPA